MSFPLMKLVFECEKKLRPIEDHVLLYIANKVNEKKGNVAWCSHAYLCKKTGYSPATIVRACKSLKEKGLISWVHKKAYNSKYKTNHYTINHSSLEAMVIGEKVSERATHNTHTDNKVGVTVSNNNLTNNLTYNLATLDKLFEQNKDKISLKQKSMAESWTSSYLKSYTQSFEYQRVYCYVVLWLKLGQTQTLWDDFQTGIKSPIEMGWSKGSFCNFH